MKESNIMDIRRAPVLKMLFPYIAGIVLSHTLFSNLNWDKSVVFIFTCFILYVLSFFYYTQNTFLKQVHFFSFLIFFVALGVFNSKRNTYQQDFFDSIVSDLEEAEGYVFMEGKETANRLSYTIFLQKGWLGHQEINLKEKIYLSLPKEGAAFQKLYYGDRIWLKLNLREISAPKNEGEFDYRQFSKRKGISYQQYGRAEDVQLLNQKGGNPLIRSARALRRQIVGQYEQYIGNSASVEIVSALVLGYRNEMSSETFDLFSNTGTIHILSVSGMHVGIIFGFILFLLYPLPRNARWLLSLVLVWLYAVFAGLAPSVLRASLMISIYVISRVFYLQNNTLQVLSLTAFVLLLISPEFLYQVGFQLSFLAVLGILWGYPLLKKVYYTEYKYVNRLLDLLYISISAQLFTAPLTLYYFHYFPNFFLLANILVVFPAAGIMILGLALPIVPFVFLKSWIGSLLLWLTQGIWLGLEAIHDFSFSKTSGIFLSQTMVILLYFLLIVSVATLYTFQKRRVKLLCIVLLLFLFHRMVEKKYYQDKIEMRIYNLGNNVAISYIDKGKVFLATDKEKTTPSRVSRSVLPYLQKYTKMENYEPILVENKNVNIAFKEERKLSVWTSFPSLLPKLEGVKWILIRNQSLPEGWILEQEKRKFQSILFVFDASNNDFYIERIGAELEKQEIEHYVLKNNFTYVWLGDRSE